MPSSGKFSAFDCDPCKLGLKWPWVEPHEVSFMISKLSIVVNVYGSMGTPSHLIGFS